MKREYVFDLNQTLKMIIILNILKIFLIYFKFQNILSARFVKTLQRRE